MRYFLIAGEASGDLHAAHLMKALREADPEAEFRCYGGDRMRAAGGELLCLYRHLAYMGFVRVAMHLPTILRGMARCKRQIREWKPDAVVLVDYPGFNLQIARYVKREGICPVFYYISPKIWAWKEYRIHAIRRDVDRLFSILPFEVEYFSKRHQYDISYVGNPTVDEVADYRQKHGVASPDGQTIALLPGSRHQEVEDNLSRMLEAARPLMERKAYRLVIAAAPALPHELYESIILRTGIERSRIALVEGRTYEILSHATAALVTSGTATLETALFGVPQVVCYFMRFGRLMSWLRRHFLKVPYISLVNLVCGREVVTELVADGMTVDHVRCELEKILPGGEGRDAMLRGYADMEQRLGTPGAPARAAAEMVARLRA